MNEDKELWIKETQMFQRVAKVPESSYEDLEKDFERFSNRRIKAKIKKKKIHDD